MANSRVFQNHGPTDCIYNWLFSLVPCVGLLLAIPALVLGIIGLRNVKANPAIRGSVHAWIGIIMGGLMTIVWSLAILLAAIASIS